MVTPPIRHGQPGTFGLHTQDSFTNSNLANIQREELQRKIDLEVENFSQLLRNNNGEVIKKTDYNPDFWKLYSGNFPSLHKLAIIMLGIPASSAGIERFFSMCGFFSKKQSGNEDADFFMKKCIMRANLDIIEFLENIQY